MWGQRWKGIDISEFTRSSCCIPSYIAAWILATTLFIIAEKISLVARLSCWFVNWNESVCCRVGNLEHLSAIEQYPKVPELWDHRRYVLRCLIRSQQCIFLSATCIVFSNTRIISSRGGALLYYVWLVPSELLFLDHLASTAPGIQLWKCSHWIYYF